MTRYLFVILLVTGCNTGFEAAPDTMPKSQASVPVAGYLNDPAIEARVMGVLNNHSIPIVAAVCSLGCTLHVDADRADEARAVLREAAERDQLPVVIYDPLLVKGCRGRLGDVQRLLGAVPLALGRQHAIPS